MVTGGGGGSGGVAAAGVVGGGFVTIFSVPSASLDSIFLTCQFAPLQLNLIHSALADLLLLLDCPPPLLRLPFCHSCCTPSPPSHTDCSALASPHHYNPPRWAPTDTGCYNTDNGAQDTTGDSCSDYSSIWCGGYDDNDFDSNAMCCICGGGSTTIGSAPYPVQPTTTKEASNF